MAPITTTSSSSSSSSSKTLAGGAGGGDCPAALDLVRPLQPLLAGFAHRNRNQHRGARWFASFAMLRRHVDKLADETAARAARPPQKKTKKKRRRKRKPHDGDGDNDDDDDDDDDDDEGTDDGPAPRRARWLRDVLVPKCYLAFSQLAADNQFATLGVVLLGALAQVRRACVCLAGEATEAASASAAAAAAPPPASALVPTTTASAATTTTTTTTAAAAAAAASHQPAGGAGGVGEAVDVGEAVSRDALVGAAAGGRPPKKRKKPAAGAGPGDAPAPSRNEADAKPAKKKKKAKKGDEFDDLFSSIF